MKYATQIFKITAQIETVIEAGYVISQDFIKNDCPVIEKRLKKAALAIAEMLLEFSLVIINWASEQIEKRDEYAVKTKRFVVRQAIEIVSFYQYCQIILSLSLDTAYETMGCKSTQFNQVNQRYQLTTKAAKILTQTGTVAASTVATKFLRSFNQALQW